MRYCVLDLTKFMFKYAKAPTEVFTQIHLKDIIDIVLENDPKPKGAIKQSFFSPILSKKNEAENGFNFNI